MPRIKNTSGTKKETILETAAGLFYLKGYPATTMRDIAEKLDIEAASLYNHIRSKSQILQEICFSVATSFMMKMDEIETSEKNSIAKLESILRLHIRQMIENHEEVYASDREWKHLIEPYLSNFRTQRRLYRKRFAAIIEEGISKKEIRAVDAPTAVLIMLQAVNGIDSWHRSKQKISAQRLEDNMVVILIEGLKAG